MSSRIFSVPETIDWKQAYMAAIREKDHSCVSGRIQHAREKLSTRLRELNGVGPFPSDEVEAIHDAFYLLQALQSSLAYRNEHVAPVNDADRVA
jgi:hypothetical protein